MELLSSAHKLAFTSRVGGDRDTSKKLKNSSKKNEELAML